MVSGYPYPTDKYQYSLGYPILSQIEYFCLMCQAVITANVLQFSIGSSDWLIMCHQIDDSS